MFITIATTLIVIFAAITIIVFLYINNKKNKLPQEKGILLGKLNLAQREVLVYKSKANTLLPKKYFTKNQFNVWMPFEDLLKKYASKENERIIRGMFVKMRDEQEHIVKRSFITSINKKAPINYKVHIEMNHIQNNNQIGFSVKWEKIDRMFIKNEKFPFETKESIANGEKKYKALIAFRLNSRIRGDFKKFIVYANKTFNIKKYRFFINDNNFIMVYESYSNERIKRELRKIKAKTEKNKKFIFGTSNILLASSFVYVSSVNSPKKLNDTLDLLDYGINESLLKNQKFVHVLGPNTNTDDLKVFRKGLRDFKEFIKLKDIDTTIYHVKVNGRKAKLPHYIYPKVKNIDPELQKRILIDPDTKKAFINTYTEIIAVKNNAADEAIIDINYSWFEKNYEKLTNKKLIYLINYDKSLQRKTINIIKKMQEDGFEFAIRIKKLDEITLTLLHKIKHKYLFIDKTLSNFKIKDKYIQLISIKQIGEKIDTIVIYENAPKEIDLSIKQKLGLKHLIHNQSID